jgi:hypothetical protein
MANDELIYRIQFDGASDAEKALIKLKREMASLTEQTKANKSEQLQASKDLKNGAITQEEYNSIIQKSTQEQIKLELSTKATRTEMQLAEKTVMSNAEALKNNGAQMVANAKATDTSNLSMKQLSAELSKNKKAYQDLTKEERDNKAIGGELLKLIEQQDAEYKELHVSIGNNQVMVGSYQDAVNSLLPVMGGLGGQIQGVIGTLGQIKDAFAKVGAVVNSQRTVIKGFGSATSTASDEVSGISASLGNATAQTIGFGQAQTISTGATNTATASTIGFQRATQTATASTTVQTTALRGQTIVTKAMSVATNLASKGLKLFRVALISTGIGAIVVALGSLIAAFASTQRGADAISRALAPIKEVFAMLVGFLQDKALVVFDRLKQAIDNPKQAFQDLLDFIKQNVINRFKGVQMFFEGWAQTFVNVFKTFGLKLKRTLNDVPIIGSGLDKEALKKLDKDIETAVKKVQEGAEKMANGALQAASGIEKPFDKIKKGFNDVADAVAVAEKRAKRMQDLTKAIRQSEITLNLDLERNRRKMEEQKLILENQLLPIEQRNKAGKEYMRLLDANIKRESDLSKMKLELARLGMEANDTDDAQKKEYYDMVAENEKMLAEATGKRIEVQNKLNDFQKQEIANKKLAVEELKKKEEEARIEREKAEIETNKKIALDKLATLEFELKKEEILNDGKLKTDLELQKEHEEKIFNLKLENLKALGLNELELKREHQLSLLEIEKETLKKQQEAKEEADKIAKAKAEEEEKKNAELLKNKEKARIELAINSAETIAKGVIENQNRRLSEETKREIEALNLRKQAGEISEEEFAKKRLEIDRKAFEKKKTIDTKEALINGAVAVMKTIAQLGFVNPLLPFALAGLGVTTGAQITSIQAQKFRFGGNVGGATHSRGGTMIEAERGEAVMMREAVNPITAPILSAINTSYGGNPISALNDFKGSNNNSSGGMQTIEVVNVATDTARINTRVKNLQTSKSF